MGCSKSSSKRAVNSNISLTQETRKIILNNLTSHLKQLEKEEEQKQKTKLSRRKGTVKIRAEISEKEIRKTNSKEQ